MDSDHQIILRMELQIGQLIRLVANLNERVDELEQEKGNQEIHRVLQINRTNRV